MIVPAPLFAAAAVSLTLLIGGVGDYELVTQLPERICAKSLDTCETAREAIRRGWFLTELPRDTPTHCRPAAGCFGPASLTIPGFNAPARLP